MCDINEGTQIVSKVVVKIEPVSEDEVVYNGCDMNKSFTVENVPTIPTETIPMVQSTNSMVLEPLEVECLENGDETYSFQNSTVNKVESTITEVCSKGLGANSIGTKNNESLFNYKGITCNVQNVLITKKVYICNVCQYKCFKSGNVQKHIKRHQKRKPTNNEAVTNDIGYSTQNITATEKVYGCDRCDYKCFRLSNLKGHFKSHKYCAYNFDKPVTNISDESSVNAHTAETIYSCDNCDYICYGSVDFKMHMKSHTGENTESFECTICNYLSFSKIDLKRHIKTHTGEKPYACGMCDYRCAQLCSIKKHIARTHSEESPVKCEKCDILFKSKREFKQHNRIHAKEKLVECEICHKMIFAGKLKYHIKTHTGEKPLKCDLCKYRCVEPSNLRRHMRKHTGERPHKCSQCQYRASCSSTLKNHIRNKHGTF